VLIATAAFAIDPSEPLDEAMGGRTLKGTLVKRRLPECFPAEQRDVFSEMDKVASGPGASLEPLNFGADPSHKISDKERNAIRGRNTWLLWGGGNEEFWGWLQEEGYGLTDFLVLLDSRNRDHRFRDAGVINQPGFVSNSDPGKRICGLFLDLPDENKVKLVPPATDLDENGQPAKRKEFPGPGTDSRAYGPPPRRGATQSCYDCHVAAGNQGDRHLFETGDDRKDLDDALSQLADDGLDPRVYGYASGIFGLRLMLNPDFFGNTPEAKKAREYWQDRVTNDKTYRYYTDYSVQADPQLIRPFRVSMSCGFCHVGPHPLNPPKDPEHPEWANLSSIIGDQYWSPQAAFANLLKTAKQKEQLGQTGQRGNFLHHFLASQQPGTIDTSLVSTDWINNSNTINAVFDVPARLTRAMNNQPEKQSAANLLLPSVEEKDASVNPRHFPRVLVDGSDSCGVFTALIRVPLNIGTYFEEWRRTSNPIIGFAHQRPFSVAVCQANSVYWQTNERYRVPYEAAFFTYQNAAHTQSSTGPMKLRDTPDGKAVVDAERAQATAGRAVFIQHCAICHSSKQPADFQLSFSREWEKTANIPQPAASPMPEPPPHYTLPMDFAYWDAFKKSAAYADYVERIKKVAGDLPPDSDEDPFIKDNFLSSEIRIPVSLVGTNSGRATATNALRGEVWDNFSSDDYKDLPAVGPIRYFDPFSGATPDDYGNNASYSPGGGGRGYYRPASLISLWATAPYLHNNTLGLYNQDPSVTGRLAAYEDGIKKLLWKDLRARDSSRQATNPPDGSVRYGDLRPMPDAAAAHDPGFIYRLPEDTEIFMAPRFIQPLLAGILGEFLTNTLATYIWILLFLVFLAAAIWSNQRHVTFLFILLALIVAAGLAMTGVASVLGRWLWLIPIALLAIALVFYFFSDTSRPSRGRFASRVVFALATLATLVIGVVTHRFINGEIGPLRLGPIPRGTPVNLIMNMDPDNPNLLQGLAGLTRGIIRVRNPNLKNDDQRYAAFISEAAGPMMRASKCPDFVLDRGHYFGEGLTDEEKKALVAFLKTL
jgi:hypothetical protein